MNKLWKDVYNPIEEVKSVLEDGIGVDGASSGTFIIEDEVSNSGYWDWSSMNWTDSGGATVSFSVPESASFIGEVLYENE